MRFKEHIKEEADTQSPSGSFTNHRWVIEAKGEIKVYMGATIADALNQAGVDKDTPYHIYAELYLHRDMDKINKSVKWNDQTKKWDS